MNVRASAAARRVLAAAAVTCAAALVPAAAGLRVYPPNQTKSRIAPFPFIACSKRGPIYLSIGPVGFP